MIKEVSMQDYMSAAKKKRNACGLVVKEFFDSGFEVAEVPIEGRTAIATANSLFQYIKRKKLGHKVRCSRCGDRVFLVKEGGAENA